MPPRRPRKIWSCLACRRKKLTCDHVRPACGRCTRIGEAALCQYADNVTLEASARDQVSVTDNEDLLLRLRALENTLAKLPSSSGLPTSQSQSFTQQVSPVNSVQSPPVKGTTITINSGLLRGGSFRTKFNGNTCTRSLADNIPGLVDFTTNAAMAFPAFRKVQVYLNQVDARTKLTVIDAPPKTKIDLRNVLPARRECDRLVQSYFETFHHIYPVVDENHFWNHYEQVWLVANEPEERFIILILLVAALAKNLSTNNFISLPHESGKGPREWATFAFDTCEFWLSTRVLNLDHIVEFQTGFLLLLGKQINQKRCKRTYANSGNVMRQYMCAGLHRSPEHLSQDTSPWDKHMRLRLFHALAEFELQAAFEHGMPATPWLQQSDLDLQNGLPEYKLQQEERNGNSPITTKTDYLSLLGQSLELRHTLCSELNNIRHTLALEEAQRYTSLLKKHLLHVSNQLAEAPLFVQVMASVTLHQYILAIHTSLLRTLPSNADKQLSRLVLLESATQIIDLHQRAIEGGGRLVEALNEGLPRAALTICHAFMTADPSSDQFLRTSIEMNGVKNIQRAMALFSDKTMHFGISQLSLWLIAAAEALIKCYNDPEKRDEYMQEAVTKFATPYERQMALFEQAGQNAVQAGPSALGPQNDADELQVVKPGNATDEAVAPTNLDELTNWALDNLIFDGMLYDSMDFDYTQFEQPVV